MAIELALCWEAQLHASQPGLGGSPREELKIKGEEICLGEELERKNW